MVIEFLIVLTNIIISIKGEIIFLSSQRRNYLTSDTEVNNIVSIIKHGSNYYIEYGFAADNYHLLELDLNFDPTGYQIRTSKFNSQFENSSYILFNLNTAALYNSNLTQYQLIYACLAQERIQDITFGQSRYQMFMLTSEIINSTNISFNIYYFDKYMNETNTSITYFPQNAEAFPSIKKLKYKQDSIFIMFNSFFLIYGYNYSERAFYQKYQQYFNQTNQSCVDFDISVTSDFLIYNDCENLYYLNYSQLNFTILHFSPFLQETNRTSVHLLLAERYLILLLGNTLYQIDYPNRAIIGQFNISGQEISKVRYLKDIRSDSIGYIILNIQNNRGFSQLTFLSLLTWYPCFNQSLNISTCHCLNSYRFFSRSQKCVLIRQSYSHTLPNVVINPDTLNTTISVEEPKKKKSRQNIFSSEISKQLSESVGILGNFASLRISPKFIISILSIFDQLFYYQYHQYQYPETLQYAFTNIQIANQLRLDFIISQMLANLSNIFTHKDFVQSNQKYLSYLQLRSNKLTQAYFLSSTQLFYKQNILQCIILYSVLKVVHFIFFILLKFSSFFQPIYNIFKYQTKWWTLIVNIVQGNIMSLVFYSTIQFCVPSHFIFENKISFIILLLFFLIIFLYSFAFYPIISRNKSRKESQILLIKCRYLPSSFIFESYCFIFRAILKSIIHGLFISNYKVQIIQLLISDIPFLMVSIYYRKLFLNCFVFLFVILYFMTTFALNFFFVMELFFTNYNFIAIIAYFEEYRQTFVELILYVLVASTVMISFTILVTSLCGQIKNLFQLIKKNQIFPISFTEKSQQKKSQSKKVYKQQIFKIKDPNRSETNFKIFISRRKGRSSPNIINISRYG